MSGTEDTTDRRLFERDLFGDPIIPPRQGPLAERFLIPPFSVFDSRAGYWQDRKRSWLSLGLQSELGRDDELTFSNSLKDKEKYGGFQSLHQTSIFDPVLCEALYRWFCPAGGQVVDPFAGGSVRGIVAAFMGRRYWGCDLRLEQVDANGKQAASILTAPPIPVWVCGDSAVQLDVAPEADFILSCPPYGDLERYSDDPQDLSTMPWDQFFDRYEAIIGTACSRLRQNSFACFVVANFRGPDGRYHDLVAATSAIFQSFGLGLYNEAVLLNTLGTVPVRVSSHFDKSRKLGKTHQNILVFVKGSWKAAVSKCSQNEPVIDDGTVTPELEPEVAEEIIVEPFAPILSTDGAVQPDLLL